MYLCCYLCYPRVIDSTATNVVIFLMLARGGVASHGNLAVVVTVVLYVNLLRHCTVVSAAYVAMHDTEITTARYRVGE